MLEKVIFGTSVSISTKIIVDIVDIDFTWDNSVWIDKDQCLFSFTSLFLSTKISSDVFPQRNMVTDENIYNDKLLEAAPFRTQSTLNKMKHHEFSAEHLTHLRYMFYIMCDFLQTGSQSHGVQSLMFQALMYAGERRTLEVKKICKSLVFEVQTSVLYLLQFMLGLP